MTAMAQHTIFYVGTYTRTTSEGIYVSRMDNAAGAVEQLSVIGGIDNPSFVALDPRGERLYAVSEIDEFEGEASGAVYAYAISPGSGALTFLNRQPTGGPGPCHLTVD
ncbi:MAG: beta-propeller fold lactonase family protein, partial [SAR202 cluster bacterium]|nr:beta-propeller fold lactonase family protein [SAR202 cluster bacterium]